MKKKHLLLLLLIFITFSCFGLAVQANTTYQISKTNATMEVTSSLKVYLSKLSAKKVIWVSSNEEIATVSAWGTVKALSEGTATITGTYQDQAYTCTVSVVDSDEYLITATPTPSPSPSPSPSPTPSPDSHLEDVDFYKTIKNNLLPNMKTLMTIGIDKRYIDVNDANYTNGTIPAFAVLTKSNEPDAYITGISCPSSGTIRFHFNTTITNASTIVINYSLPDSTVSPLEQEVDLVIFMGQSNASGVGIAKLAPSVPSVMGSEFRAISDPTTLYDINEPFGVNENKMLGINDRTLKTGSMVSAFVNSYYAQTGRKLICVSASQGATSITMWQPGDNRLNDAVNRFTTAITWLEANNYTIKNKFVVWCQGETDGGAGMSGEAYTENMKKTIDTMLENGADNFYIVRIGNNRDEPTLYESIISAQTDLCKTYKNTILASTKLSIMASNGMMKDKFHYTQHGYNIVGYDAGINVAYHILTGKEPTMYDYQSKTVYDSTRLRY